MLELYIRCMREAPAHGGIPDLHVDSDLAVAIVQLTRHVKTAKGSSCAAASCSRLPLVHLYPAHAGLLPAVAARPTTGQTGPSVHVHNQSRCSTVSCQAISAPAVPASGRAPYYFRETASWPTAEELQLVEHDLGRTPHVDLVVAGAGPAGVAIAQRVAAAGFTVCVVDPEPTGIWPNNYGVWVDEFQAMGLEDCLEVVWPKAKVWLDNGELGAKFLDRPYGRVDRPYLKRKLLTACKQNGVTFINGAADSVSHGGGSSTLRLKDGRTISASMVVDATGHVRKLVKYDKKFDPGYQGAYGIVAEVESHPFDIDTMLFMDWRDDHTAGNPAMRESNKQLPTFLYAMPFSKTKIFLEETSLVARPAVGFQELKDRLDGRLKHLGIKVKHIEEEEYCLIPMGGVLPTHPQRVVGIGGTAGMVHPSTGFMVSRALGAAPTVADAIIDQLSRPADKATNSGAARKPRDESEANSMAAAVWRAMWPVERIRQRAFNTFGMDMLLSMNLAQTRQFFNAFFSLSDFHWHGFLSTRLSFTELVGFGLALFVSASNDARLNLLQQGVPGLLRMLVEIFPTVTGSYYKDAPTVKDQKAAADLAASRGLVAKPVSKPKVPVTTMAK